MEIEKFRNYDIYLKESIDNNNLDILSILDFTKIDEKFILDIFILIKNYYSYNDRHTLHEIKKYYESIFYKEKTNISKIKYIMILCIGNTKNTEEIFYKYLKNFKDMNIDDEIISLEKRLSVLKYEISNIYKNNEDNSDNDEDNSHNDNNQSISNRILVKKKIKLV